MDFSKDLLAKIVCTTEQIQVEFPELAKYISEMPEHYISSRHAGVNGNEMQDYLDSLQNLLETYTYEQSSTSNPSDKHKVETLEVKNNSPQTKIGNYKGEERDN
jgi:flagellar biosynthesis chaperone FliJ